MIVTQFKHLLKRFASPVLDAAGLYDGVLRHMPDDAWTIVMYHRVVDDLVDDPFRLGMCVTRRHFRDQLRYFRRRYTPIGLGEAVQRFARGEPLPPRALSVTFDDGYLDNFTVALPVLQAEGVGATLFVPTGGLDDDTPLWWDRVIRALDATDAPHLVPSELGLPLPHARLSLSSWHRPRTVSRVLDALWTLEHPKVLQVLERIERAFPPARPVAPVARRMTRDQVREMHRAGIEIGAHSVRHSNLRLETPAVVRQEMLMSKRELESLCEAPIRGFAYPAGWKSADTEIAARECGFDYAVSTVSGLNAAAPDLFALQRVGMPDTSVSDLKRALSSLVQRGGARADGQG